MRAKIETTLSLSLTFQEAQNLKTVVEAGISALREHSENASYKNDSNNFYR